MDVWFPAGMNVFISWSGNRSRAVAEMMRDWIKCVIQVSKPWISTRDIDRGALWFTEINAQLKENTVGIICLTQENKNRPWILFEAGALAKGLTTARVCTLLVDLQPADIGDPLAQFNHTLPTRENMLQLTRTLNGCASINPLDDRILEEVFNTYWPLFEEKFAAALAKHPPTEKIPKRNPDTLLEEILESTRSLGHRIRRVEAMSENQDFLNGRNFGNQLAPTISSALLQIHTMLDKKASPELILNALLQRGFDPDTSMKLMRDVKLTRSDSSKGIDLSES
ncbi:MAG: hypothetical protein WDM80_04905 [Limisphaerales bacterium]